MSVVAVPKQIRAPKAHSVEFFTRAAFPASDIAHRLADALVRGYGAGALATAPHLEALRAELGRAVDVAGHLRAERLVLIDADEVYQALVATPAEGEAILGSMLAGRVRQLVARYGRARLYGELVDLYCSDGDRDGAIALERWWNRQLESLPVELHCGYSVDSFADGSTMTAFRHVCDEHGEVVPQARSLHESRRLTVEVEQLSTIVELEAARRLAIEAAYEGSRASEHRTREHLATLQRLTSALCEAATFADIGKVATGELATAVMASRCVLVIGGELIAASGVVVPEAAARELDTLSADWYAALERPPELAWFDGDTVAVVPPLAPPNERAGTLVLGFERLHAPSQLVDDLARQLYIAIDRARSCERALRERVRAEAANTAKDRFLAMLGHELRNPLSPILTAAQLMRLRAPDMLVQERSMIERSVTHMMRIVDDLLDVAKITRGNITLVRAPIDVAEIIAQALELASTTIEERAHSVQVAVAPGLVVDGDGARLVQVVANLIGNAAKYTRERGLIDITVSATEDTIEIAVTDNGIGIAPTLLPLVFEPFVQGPPGSDVKNGLGLGLAIARKIVELHDGVISAASDGPNTGSRFTISLPRAREAARKTESGNNPVEPREGGERIMVVDDNDDAAWLLAEALRFAGHDVLISHDGIDALERARVWQPSIAFLDVGLPGMDGYTLCRHLVELPSRPKVVAVTGYGRDTDRARALAAGFDMHFVKPVSLREVHSAIAAFSKHK